MIALDELMMLGETLFNSYVKNPHYDLQKEMVVSDINMMDASSDIPPDKIFCKLGNSWMFSGKMLVSSDDNYNDISRYLPIPFLSLAKECQDYVRKLCGDQTKNPNFSFNDSEEFEHDFFNFERIVSHKEKNYIAGAYDFINKAGCEYKVGKVRREYRINIAKRWCDLKGIVYLR